ncbi:unnamed protein product [Sphagnum compactum]
MLVQNPKFREKPPSRSYIGIRTREREGKNGGNFNILCPQRYDHLQKISVEGHTKKEISKIVFECAESTFQSIKDHPTDGDNQKILKLFEDGGEGCAMNVHQMTLNENLAT